MWCNGEMCHSTRPASCSGKSRPVSLQMYILDGALKATNRKMFSRILCVLGVSSSPTDPVKIFRSSLRKCCVHLRGEKWASLSKDSYKLSPHEDHDAGLAAVAKR